MYVDRTTEYGPDGRPLPPDPLYDSSLPNDGSTRPRSSNWNIGRVYKLITKVRSTDDVAAWLSAVTRRGPELNRQQRRAAARAAKRSNPWSEEL